MFNIKLLDTCIYTLADILSITILFYYSKNSDCDRKNYLSAV